MSVDLVKELRDLVGTLRRRRLYRSAEMVTETIAEVERLRAIEAKLPLTADGVVVVPGLEVWLAGFIRYPGYVEHIMGDDLVAVNDMADWPAEGCDSIREYTVRHPATLYSTREAAEAAMKGGPQ